YYLRSAKAANTAAGDGTLATEAPKNEPAAGFEYDPANPVRTIGGRLCCGAVAPPGPFDQRPNESRPDVLVFSTPPLAQDVEVTGYVRLELFASTSAVDTDFTALLADGIVRARYRAGTDKAELIEPGRVYKYDVDLWATSNLFKAGHRIRLYVS